MTLLRGISLIQSECYFDGVIEQVYALEHH